jgi:P4 family phage/plasmid primase-like protien
MPPKTVKDDYLLLRECLDRNRVTKTGEENITEWTGNSMGKYAIPEQDYEKFLKMAHATIFGDKPRACGLLEKHLAHGGPICIDLDFKYTAGSHLQRRFDDEMLNNFVVQYAAALYRFFDLSVLNGKPLRFFVMLKPAPEVETKKEKTNHKDGVHIICPDLTLDPQTQHTIRGYLIEKRMVASVFGDAIGYETEEKIFDKSVIHSNNWFIYGATKPDKAWYSVNNIIVVPSDLDVGVGGEEARVTAVEESVEEEDLGEYDDWDLTKTLSIRLGHATLTPMKILEDRKFEWEAHRAKWGVGKPAGRAQTASSVTPLLGGASSPQNEILGDDFVLNEGQAAEGHDEPGYTADDINQVCELVDKCLNPERRAKDYGSWIDLGVCLYNISDGERMLKKWVDFSRRVEGYSGEDDEVYAKKWRSFSNIPGIKKIRLGSLHFWAREDNPSRYKEITERSHVGWIINQPDATHVKVATLVRRMYQHEFCCTITGPKRLDYFQYVGNYWKKLKSNNELRARLTIHVARVYLAAVAEAGRLAALAGGALLGTDASVATAEAAQAKSKAMQEKSKILLKSCNLLEGAPFKDNIMKECNEKFYDENFVDQLNQRKDTFACGNCVIELRHYPGGEIRAGTLPKVHARKGRPDDYISFVMGRENELEPIVMDYDSKSGDLLPFDANTPEQRELADFFSKVFPDAQLREFMLTLLASCLEGDNREQKFIIMTGSGGNGKSVLINMMRFTLGEYQTSLNTAALTRKRPESGAANPDIITLKAKRFIYMQEPDEGEKLNTARIKQFTGGDVVEARGLFADQEKFKIMGRIFFSTNDLPPVGSMDGGTWRRMLVIPFISAFKDPGDPMIDAANHIYEKDSNLEDKFKQNNMRAAFLRLLLHYWETRYLKHGLEKSPPCVMEAINRYKQDNDSFVAFSNETLIRETGSTASLSEISSRYKYWISTQPGRKVLKKPELIERMTRLFKTTDGGRTYNDVRVALDGEDISGNYVGGGAQFTT